MGYTHYWTFRKALKGQATKTEEAYQKAVRDCQKVILAYSKVNGGLSGYSAHTKVGQYGGINVNGSGQLSHEPFILREHFSENEGFNFCKTAQKPYDTVVVACLIILKHRLKDLIHVSSDGNEECWKAGLKLAKNITGIKSLNIPESIKE